MTYRPKHPTLKIAKTSVVAGQARGGYHQRARLLAYAYLRGKAYRVVERSRWHNDLHVRRYLRICVAAYVQAWNDGRVEPEATKWGHVTERAPEVEARVKLWATTDRGADCTKAIVRCPDLAAPDVQLPQSVSTEAPLQEDGGGGGGGRGFGDLLAQVRSWIKL